MNPIMRYFEYEHLPAPLQAISKPLCDIAYDYDVALADSAEKSAGLRKLLEAKDCFVRAALVTPVRTAPIPSGNYAPGATFPLSGEGPSR